MRGTVAPPRPRCQIRVGGIFATACELAFHLERDADRWALWAAAHRVGLAALTLTVASSAPPALAAGVDGCYGRQG